MQSRTDKLLVLLEKHGPSLHALLTRLTFREDIAEDLMQDLFIRLHNSHKLESVENMPAFARTVAMNLAFDWRRKMKLRRYANTDDVPEPAAGERGVLDRMVADERMQAVLNAADRLSKVQRKVFVMRYIEQQSIDQIAQETGKTSHHVRALCSRALNKVRDLCAKTMIQP
ncbi:RNA polymerase sigma factor [Planctomycetota bacterium]